MNNYGNLLQQLAEMEKERERLEAAGDLVSAHGVGSEFAYKCFEERAAILTSLAMAEAAEMRKGDMGVWHWLRTRAAEITSEAERG